MNDQDDRSVEGRPVEGRSREDRSHEGRSTGRPEDRVEEGHPVISTTRARQGKTLGAMRYVLGVSIALVIIVFAVAYVITIVIPH